MLLTSLSAFGGTYSSARTLLGELEASEAATADAVEQHPRVASGLPPDVEARPGKLLHLRLVAEVGEPAAVLADDPKLVDRQHEVAREVLEVLALDDGVALVEP